MVTGVERMGIAPTDRMAGGDYQAERDIEWLSGQGDFLSFGPGQFMILWPGDAHMPGVEAGIPGPARKVVVKIKIDE
jgi:biofilm protein TabA